MTKTLNRILAGTAALGLVAAPIVAHANTRAGISSTSYSTSNALPGLGRASSGEGQEGGTGSIILGLAAAGLVIAGIVLASDDGECASPGAC
jgi:hypothetical protein